MMELKSSHHQFMYCIAYSSIGRILGDFLLGTSSQSIINRFLESYTTEIVDDNVEYKIKIRKPYEDIGETAIIFLLILP